MVYLLLKLFASCSTIKYLISYITYNYKFNIKVKTIIYKNNNNLTIISYDEKITHIFLGKISKWSYKLQQIINPKNC